MERDEVFGTHYFYVVKTKGGVLVGCILVFTLSSVVRVKVVDPISDRGNELVSTCRPGTSIHCNMMCIIAFASIEAV